MNVTSAFIIYLVLFRIAIIASGTVSIVLGYKLFCKGIGLDDSSKKGTDVDAKIAGTSIKLKNAAPGTCFALFGVVIISIMFIYGGPELTMKTIEDATKVDQTLSQKRVGVENVEKEQTELKLRGNDNDLLSKAIKEGLFYEGEKDTIKAIAAYEKAINLMAEPMNNLSWLYLGRGNVEEALPLSKMAVMLTPHDPNHLDTHAEILFKLGNYAEALKTMEKAANLDSQYQDKLPKYRQAVESK